MAPSLPALPLLLALVLGIALPAQAYDQLDYCQPPRICPQFTRISTNQKYEERLYESSVWICTPVNFTNRMALKRASRVFINYMIQPSWLQAVGNLDNVYPVLIKVKQGVKGQEYSICFLVPPGVTVSGSGKVTVETLPKASMFVRSFEGTPSFCRSQEYVQNLMQDLAADGEGFNQTVYYAVEYAADASFTNHNEVWVPKD